MKIPRRVLKRVRVARGVVVSLLGPQEVLLAIALTLIVVAIWPVSGRMALAVPGVVILWIALPQRESLVTRRKGTD